MCHSNVELLSGAEAEDKARGNRHWWEKEWVQGTHDRVMERCLAEAVHVAALVGD